MFKIPPGGGPSPQVDISKNVRLEGFQRGFVLVASKEVRLKGRYNTLEQYQ